MIRLDSRLVTAVLVGIALGAAGLVSDAQTVTSDKALLLEFTRGLQNGQLLTDAQRAKVREIAAANPGLANAATALLIESGEVSTQIEASVYARARSLNDGALKSKSTVARSIDDQEVMVNKFNEDIAGWATNIGQSLVFWSPIKDQLQIQATLSLNIVSAESPEQFSIAKVDSRVATLSSRAMEAPAFQLTCTQNASIAKFVTAGKVDRETLKHILLRPADGAKPSDQIVYLRQELRAWELAKAKLPSILHDKPTVGLTNLDDILTTLGNLPANDSSIPASYSVALQYLRTALAAPIGN